MEWIERKNESSQSRLCISILVCVRVCIGVSNGSKVVQFGDGPSTRKSISCKLKRWKDYRRLYPCVWSNQCEECCVCACWLAGFLACFLCVILKGKEKKKNANKITAYVRCDTHVCLHAYKRKHTITARHTPWTNSMLCKRSIDVYVLQWLFRMCCLHALMCAWPCLGPCMCDMKSVARLYTCISLCECVCISVWMVVCERQSNRIIKHRHSVVKMASHRSH